MEKSIRIVGQVRSTFWAITETFILNYLKNLERWTPIILTQKLINHEKLNDFRICQFPGISQIKRWSRNWWMKQYYNRILSIEGEALAYALLRTLKVHIIHAHFGYDGCGILGSAKRLGIPLITTFYGGDVAKLDQRDIWWKRYQSLFHYGSLFLVEGHHMKKMLVELGCPEEKISIQRIAINIDSYDYREREYDRSRPLRILLCGRFVEKKGFSYALKALDWFAANHPLEVEIIGDGREKKSLTEIVDSSSHLKRSVKWLGMLNHDQTIMKLEYADWFLQPSVTAANGDTEGGAPTMLLEAQACGVPIIATTHADIPNVTVPGESALLVPERDVDALVQAMEVLANEPCRWPHMSRKGKEFVWEFHDIRKEARRLEDLYDSYSI